MMVVYNREQTSHHQRQLLVLASGDPAMALLIWDLRTGQILHRLTYEQNGRQSAVDLRGLAFSADGGVLAAGMEGDIVMWDTTNGRLLQTLPTECYDIYTITFHPTMKLLAAGSFNQLDIWIWELSDGHLLHRWEEPEVFMEEDERERGSDRPYQVAFTPDGKLLLAGCGEGGLRVWNVEQAHEVPGPDTDLCALFFALAPDGRSVAVSDNGWAVQVFEIGTWRLLHEFAGSYPSESFSPDGQVLATLYEFGDVSVWEVVTEKLLYQVSTSRNDEAPSSESDTNLFLTANHWLPVDRVVKTVFSNENEKCSVRTAIDTASALCQDWFGLPLCAKRCARMCHPGLLGCVRHFTGPSTMV